MGIFDKAKEFVAEHDDEVEKAIDKVADVVEDKVPEKNKAKVTEVADKAKGFVEKLGSSPKTNKPA
ncbi:MAG TPA: antitoxin [Ilumatobacteraceae bacterium]|nr:antitoxin [Ilumatobacteraceae bacterium]